MELDACVASTVQALQDDMQRVLERLRELETLTSSQVCAVTPGELLHTNTGWWGQNGCPFLNRQPRVPQEWRDLGLQ